MANNYPMANNYLIVETREGRASVTPHAAKRFADRFPDLDLRETLALSHKISSKQAIKHLRYNRREVEREGQVFMRNKDAIFLLCDDVHDAKLIRLGVEYVAVTVIPKSASRDFGRLPG